MTWRAASLRAKFAQFSSERLRAYKERERKEIRASCGREREEREGGGELEKEGEERKEREGGGREEFEWEKKGRSTIGEDMMTMALHRVFVRRVRERRDSVSVRLPLVAMRKVTSPSSPPPLSIPLLYLLREEEEEEEERESEREDAPRWHC